jgi:hypothetical protein
MTIQNEFHKHLDSCSHCENNPFDLCPIGLSLIKNQVLKTIGRVGGASSFIKTLSDIEAHFSKESDSRHD